MAYLGVIGVTDDFEDVTWAQAIVAVVLLPAFIGLYASHGGYVYVK